MRIVLVLLCALCALAQETPLATFTGTVHEIKSTSLTLTRAGEDDLEISCTHKTRYFKGAKRIKRTDIKPGDRVTVETTLDLYLKPEAVNVRLQTQPPATSH